MYRSHEDQIVASPSFPNGKNTPFTFQEYREVLSTDLEFLEKFVTTPSQSKNPEDVLVAQKLLAHELKDLGFEIQWVAPKGREGAPALHAIKPGLSERGICFVGHSDTVLGPGRNFNFEYDSEKMRIVGPGVADDKGGLVVALRGIRRYLEESSVHFYTLHFISSPNEEVGSLGFHEFYQEMGESADYVFGFEPALFDGSLVNCRNGNAWYRVNVKGKSAHAGRFGEVSINAAHELSRIIFSLHELNDVENKVKVNVGSISGGTGHFNVVCGEAHALIDMRFPCPDSRERLHQEFSKITAKAHISCFESGGVGEISFSIEDDCPALALTQKGEELSDLLCSIIEKYEGKRPNATHTGGAADVNYFSCPSTAIVDGMGPIGGGLHTVHEYVELPSIYTRAETLREVLVKLNRP